MRIQSKLKSRTTTKSALIKCAEKRSYVIQLQRSRANTSIERERFDEIGSRGRANMEGSQSRAHPSQTLRDSMPRSSDYGFCSRRGGDSLDRSLQIGRVIPHFSKTSIALEA
jgi:hypothetical protein